MSPDVPTSNNSHDHGTPASGAPQFAFGLDRSIVLGAGNSVRYAVFSVTAPSAPRRAAAIRPPLNLALVVDASGSMAGAPLRAACEGAASVIERLGEQDHLSLVSFASDVVVHLSAVRLDAAGKALAKAALRELDTRGSTDLAAGWLAGCEAVATRQAFVAAAERNHVVVLSDGHANQGIVDPVQLAKHAGELRARGVLTSTVGIGTGYSPVQLQAISEAGGGRMHDAERPEEIAEVLLAELADTLATTVEQLQLALHLPPLVHAEVYGTAPASHVAGEYRVLLGSVLDSATRQLVVKLTFPAGVEGATLELGATASWRNPVDGTDHVQVLPSCTLRHGSGRECAEQPRDLERARTVLAQWQSHVLHQAMVHNQRRELVEAVAFVQRELHHFSRYCRGIPGAESLLQTLDDYLRSVGHLQDAVTAKEMLLASYKRGRGEVDRRSMMRASLEDQVRGMFGRQAPR